MGCLGHNVTNTDDENVKKMNQLVDQQINNAGQIASLGAQIAVNAAEQRMNQAQAHIYFT